MPLGRGALVCLEAVELASDYLESTLARGQRRRSERHLAGCPHCTEYLAQMRETIRLAGRLVPEDSSPQMRDDFAELYHRWRNDDDDEPAPGP